MRVRDETVDLVLACIRLVDRLAVDVPLLADALAERRVRIAFDFRERVLLVSLTDTTGRARPLLAIEADPLRPEAFGSVGAPLPIAVDPTGKVH
jgi:hypothetical protein